jgi:transketolase
MLAAIQRAKKRLLKMHFESGVGHIGGNLSALDAMMVLHHKVMRTGDAFILAKGHAAGALYVTLWSIGRLSEKDLNSFHGEGTRLSAHPPPGWLPEIPFATGSLGHGLPDAVGIALGRKLQNLPGHVYCLTSDGEWQEGSNWEALIFAKRQRLDNLTILIDENRLQGFGTTHEVAAMEPLHEKFAGFCLDLTVVDGHDTEAVQQSLDAQVRSGPRFIVLKTIKGHGVSFMENAMEWHYLPMNPEQFRTAIQEIESE